MDSKEEPTTSQSNQDALGPSRTSCNNISDMKWLDKRLCQVLFSKGTEDSALNAPVAVCRYNNEENFVRQLSRTQFSANVRTPMRCVITTPCHYTRLLQCKMTRYVCDLPVLLSAHPLRLCVDVSSDVPDFHNHWDHFLTMAGGTAPDKYEWYEKVGERRVGLRLSEYDCVIFDVDYGELDVDRGYLNALVDILTPQQTFVVTGTMARIKGLDSNMDCMKHLFFTLGGFHFLPFAMLPTNWRIWCNKSQNDSIINFVEIIRWACLDIIYRRSRAPRN
ncbi:hypothetical protein ECG_04990 [Echinococcus granulosus]|nr:hypothetical protein ECG_04991 [Echinococcus granulosus]KAH9282374.1 hypothetical protein ECG_04990 [Echinococcus granulosus]